MHKKITVAIAGTAVLLGACANPVVVPPVSMQDTQQDCAALEQDIIKTGQLKKEARADDAFQWRYIFVVNAVFSAYRINKAEKAAVERLEELNRIAAAKGCLGGQEKVIDPAIAPTPETIAPAPQEPTPEPILEPVESAM